MSDTTTARRLLESGRIADAERAYQQVLETEPDHIEALNVIGLAALRAGHSQRALELLGRALAAAPQDAATLHHLGRAYESVDDFPRAAETEAAAVRAEPGFFVARLHLAACLERLENQDKAIIQYKRALDDAQRLGRWLGPATTPKWLQPLVAHAVISVRQGTKALFEQLFAPLRKQYGPDALTRVEQCVRIYLNQEPPVYVDPRQHPSFLLFPGLPTSAYLDTVHFPWIERVEGATQAVRSELDRLLPSPTGRERVFSTDALEAENLRGIDAVPSWNGYYFFRHGQRRDDNCQSCPITAGVLDSLPLPHIREHGPEVLFSVFTPGTHLMPHAGVTNTRVVAHLPLIVPEDCALKVGGEIHEWRTGKIVVFDDTYQHEAWNRSRHTRVVLIFDLWNPFLTEAERAAVSYLVGAIGDFREAVERA